MEKITSDYAKDRFLEDTKNHSMEVLMDNGVYRHLSFTDNGSSDCRFDITTWPGHLCVSGDMGTFVFSRLHDMFAFFDSKIDSKYPINPGYWGEKIEASSGTRGTSYKEFSFDLFKELVLSEYENFAADYEDEDAEGLTESYSDDKQSYTQMLSELRAAIDEEVLGCDSNDVRAFDAASEFNWQSDDGTLKFDFADFWEHDCTEYSLRYLWILYAIVWGIGKYNKAKTQEV
jgi:hypothetical protein